MLRRRLTAAAGVLLAATAIAAPAANAEIAPVDDAPAATLLLPYFEVDANAQSRFGVGFDAPQADQAPAPAQSGNDNVLWGDYYQVPATTPAADDVMIVDESVGHLDNRGHGGGNDGGHGRHGGGHGDERD